MTKPRTSGRQADVSGPDGASRRDVALTGVVTLIAGFVLAVSGFLPWFRSAIGTSAQHDINGFRKGSWLLNVPIGWVVLVAGVVLAGIGLALLAPRRVRWRPTFWLAPLVSGLTVAWIIADRFHIHGEVRSDLEAAVAKLVKAQPTQTAQAKAFLDSAHFTDRYALWLALLAAVSVTVAGVWLVQRSRRTATAASDAV